MQITHLDDTKLGTVQHQLDHLASARSLHGLDEVDERRYRELCHAERTLLENSVATHSVEIRDFRPLLQRLPQAYRVKGNGQAQ